MANCLLCSPVEESDANNELAVKKLDTRINVLWLLTYKLVKKKLQISKPEDALLIRLNRNKMKNYNHKLQTMIRTTRKIPFSAPASAITVGISDSVQHHLTISV